MFSLSYQLYSSREFPPLLNTMKMLRDAGYTHVESFGGLYDDVPALKADLDASGMTLPSGHFSVDALTHDQARTLEIAASLGIQSIYAPHLTVEKRPTDAAGWTKFGQQLEALALTYKAAGLGFGWHNHDFEFAATDDGSIPMRLILDAAPSLEWEIDIAWIVRGGADPLQWIAEYRDRLTAVHIKDIAREGDCLDEDGWADVGHGTMDWPGIMQALTTAPIRHYVMEHDNPNDHERFARRSIETVRAIEGQL